MIYNINIGSVPILITKIKKTKLMDLKENDTGVIKFGDGTSSKVYVVAIDNYRSGLPTDYWFEYQEEETHRPIIHPDLGKSDTIKSSIVLPEVLVYMVFTKD